MTVDKYIRDIQDFPKEGILFKDITPLLIDTSARKECLDILVSTLRDKGINKVIGVESRGRNRHLRNSYRCNSKRRPSAYSRRRIGYGRNCESGM